MNRVLIAGFGPFNGVIDNPSAAIAEALDGCIYNGVAVVGREMPVSHRRSIELCAMARASVDPVAILGIGVALSRTAVTIEDWASRPSMSGRKTSMDGIQSRCWTGRSQSDGSPPSTVRNSRSYWMQTLGMMPATTCATLGSFKPWVRSIYPSASSTFHRRDLIRLSCSWPWARSGDVTMAGDFDSLMAGMGVKRMEDDKHQAKATRKVKAKATTVRRKANASAAPQAAGLR